MIENYQMKWDQLSKYSLLPSQKSLLRGGDGSLQKVVDVRGLGKR